MEKLSYPATKKEITSKVDIFHQEFRKFRQKTDRFDESKGMWESSLLEQGKVHVWHDTYSVLDTQVLGWLACRVTSKILGIGSAERTWGVVKTLKQGKRARLGGDNIKKQSTIYANACIEEAKIKQKYDDNNGENFSTWTDEDVAFIKGAGIPNEDVVSYDRKLPIFRCWREDWEIEIQKKRDEVHKARFQNKYCGIRFFDIDETKYDRLLEAYEVQFTKADGYVINCKVYVNGEKQEEEPWTTHIMFDCILDRKSEYLNQHVRILKTPQEDYEEYKQPSSPAKVASMRSKTDDTSSDDDDSGRFRKKKIEKK